MLFLVGSADLADAVEGLLNRLGDLDLLGADSVEHRGHGAARDIQDGKRHGHAPKRRDGQLPTEEQRPHEHDGARDNGAPQLAQNMAVGMLHGLGVAHDSLGKVGQVAAAEERKGQLAQALGDFDALVAALLIENAVGIVVLLPVRGEEQHEEDHEAGYDGQGGGQGRARRQMLDEASHGQEQKAHARHSDQIGDRGPENPALNPSNAFIGQEVLLLE